MRIKFLFFLLLIGLAKNICSGQNTTKKTLAPLSLHRITIEDGLSHSHINDILKDHNDFIWIATKNGLNRFDSYDFKVYKHSAKDTTSLGDSKIWCLLEDSKNRLWVGTNQGGLNLFDRKTESFKKYTHDPNDDNTISQSGVTCMIEDHLGKIWVGTFWGLNEFDPDKGTFKRYYFSDDDPGSIPGNYITSLMEDNKNRIWVGTKDGICVLNRATDKFKNYSDVPAPNNKFPNTFIRDIYQDSDNDIWIATEGEGIGLYDEANDSFIDLNPNSNNGDVSKSNIVRCVAEDEKGNIWFGTDGKGVNIYDKSKGTFSEIYADNIPDFKNGAIYDILFDDKGITWFADYGKGLLTYNRQKRNFTSYKSFITGDSVFSPSSVLAIAEDQNNNIWLGTGNNGLFKYDIKTESFSQFAPSDKDAYSWTTHPIKALMIDNKNNLWAGTYADGLHKINLETSKVTHFYHNPENEHSLGNDNIWALYQDHENRIWVGTLEKGLEEYIPETDEFIHHSVEWSNDSSISSNSISVIYEDSKNRLWIGTEGGGLNLMNKENGTFKRYIHTLNDTTGITNNEVNVICEDHKKRLWVGTNGGGLHLYNPEKERFDKFQIKGEKYDAVYGMLEDANGNLWMCSNNGLFVLDPETRFVQTYNIYDGLQGNQYNYNAQLKSSSGILYFGGVNGFDHFNPANIKEDTFHPKIVITDFYLFHKQAKNVVNKGFEIQQINNSKEIILSPDQYVFGFKYAAIDYSFPKNNKYAFMLNGFDTEWNYVGKTREATYTNIPPGKYEFKVKATNNNGVWNTNPLTIKVIVLPPWWDHRWVQVLFILMGLASVLLIIRLRTRMLVNKKQRLEDEVKKRVRQIEQQKLEIEEKKEELQQQNEKIWRSHEQIQSQNDELKAKNEIILFQGKQVKEKSALLEKAHIEITAANNELKRINADLEKMVDVRTAELREAMKKLIKSDEELNTFLYRSSHDLRGPITTLLGLTRLARRENENPQIDHYFEKINLSCTNMLKVLKKLNDTNVVFKSKRVASKINVSDLIGDIELDLNKFDPNQEVEKEFNTNIESEIYSDELLLKTIIYNLMENAIIYKASIKPYVKLDLHADDKILKIVVTDNGSGIPEDIIPHIFKMFYRGSEFSKGNGLGLYLVQKSVELLNGKITLESEKYKYSRFTIKLPNEQGNSIKNLDEIYIERSSI